MNYIFCVLIVLHLQRLVAESNITHNFIPDHGKKCPVIISRQKWKAIPTKNTEQIKVTPIPYVILHHTETGTCKTEEECIKILTTLQAHQIKSNKIKDISYHFMIGGDGRVYAGRGWNLMGAHTLSYNNRSIGIALIGTFNRHYPFPKQIKSLFQLISCGLAENKIDKNYQLLGHNQVKTKRICPGNAFYTLITKMPHWVPSVKVPDISETTNLDERVRKLHAENKLPNEYIFSE